MKFEESQELAWILLDRQTNDQFSHDQIRHSFSQNERHQERNDKKVMGSEWPYTAISLSVFLRRTAEYTEISSCFLIGSRFIVKIRKLPAA